VRVLSPGDDGPLAQTVTVSSTSVAAAAAAPIHAAFDPGADPVSAPSAPVRLVQDLAPAAEPLEAPGPPDGSGPALSVPTPVDAGAGLPAVALSPPLPALTTDSARAAAPSAVARAASHPGRAPVVTTAKARPATAGRPMHPVLRAPPALPAFRFGLPPAPPRPGLLVADAPQAPAAPTASAVPAAERFDVHPEQARARDARRERVPKERFPRPIPQLPVPGSDSPSAGAGHGGGPGGGTLMALLTIFVFIAPGLTQRLRVGTRRRPRLLRAGRLERPG
jgi:hypothetical protein